MRISDWSSDVCSSDLCFEHLRLPSPPEMPSAAPHDKASFLDKAMRIIDDLAMDRAQLPLNALRAFEAAARHLNFTRAGLELHVSQGAVSHQERGRASCRERVCQDV